MVRNFVVRRNVSRLKASMPNDKNIFVINNEVNMSQERSDKTVGPGTARDLTIRMS
jgi:hypothetical protein